MDTLELIKRVRRLEIKARKSSQNLFSGAYHSSFRGRGMSFREVRAYQPGDEVRSIDWNVTARLREPYVKVLEEDRELSVLLMVDLSASSGFGGASGSKRETLLEACALLAVSALRNNDKVGLIAFSDQTELYLPPRKGKSATFGILRALIEHPVQSRRTDIAAALRFAQSVTHRKTIVFLISDFLSKPYADVLKPFGRKHDLIGLRVMDPAEKTLPRWGMVQMLNPETGGTVLVDTDDATQRRAYEKAISGFIEYGDQAFAACASALIELTPGREVAPSLFRLFAQRARR